MPCSEQEGPQLELLLLTSELHPDAVLPSLSFLPPAVRTAPTMRAAAAKALGY